MYDTYKRNARQNKYFFSALHSPHSPKPNHKACIRPEPAHWRQLGLLLIKLLWLWQELHTKWKNWRKLFIFLWDHKQEQGMRWELTMCIITAKESFYNEQGGKYWINHNIYHYSLFAITPRGIQGGRISLLSFLSWGLFHFFLMC